jgi:nitrite reductase/ring-hydroxylating ferredoxin subunit
MWIKAIKESEVKENKITSVSPKDVSIILIKKAGKMYAYSGICVHLGCPLSNSSLDGDIITCPCHDWRYDIKTGNFVDAPEISLQKYPVKSKDGDIFIELKEGKK